ncbi:MAG: hypothetical protein ACK5PP_14795 [Acidimicrobiales bacterium]
MTERPPSTEASPPSMFPPAAPPNGPGPGDEATAGPCIPIIPRAMAVAMAESYAATHLIRLGPRTWFPTPFTGGWRLTALGEDLRFRFGGTCIMVLNDGTVRSDGTLPPPYWCERYNGRLLTPDEEAALEARDGPAQPPKSNRRLR